MFHLNKKGNYWLGFIVLFILIGVLIFSANYIFGGQTNLNINSNTTLLLVVGVFGVFGLGILFYALKEFLKS